MDKRKFGGQLALGSICAVSLAGSFSPADAVELFRANQLPHGYMLADTRPAQTAEKTGQESNMLERAARDGESEAQNAKAAENPAPPKPNSKFPEGWCGDGGRCGYKRR